MTRDELAGNEELLAFFELPLNKKTALINVKITWDKRDKTAYFL